MNYLIFLLILILSCNPSEPVGFDDQESIAGCIDCGCSEITSFCQASTSSTSSANFCCDCDDLIILNEFIELNSELSFKHYYDSNSNGCIEPLEFGNQIWVDQRLEMLDISYPATNIIDPITGQIDNTDHRLKFIPNNIGNLSALTKLKLNDNSLTLLPESFTNLSNLVELEISNNSFQNLPDNIDQLQNLKNLIISNNEIDQLPPSIISMPALEKLWANNNQLDTLPQNIGNLQSLRSLHLQNNSLDSIPISLGDLLNLENLFLENNMLFSIPDICEGDNFINSNLSYTVGNNFLCTNAVPNCIENLSDQTCDGCPPHHFEIEDHCVYESDYYILQDFLDMNPNSQALTNSQGIPYDASECVNDDWWAPFETENGAISSRLVQIKFNSKQLDSEIPESFGRLDKLKILRLEANSLKGMIPDSLSQLSNLEVLKLNSNQLIGSVPSSLSSLSNLDTLWLKDNHFGCFEYDFDFGVEGRCNTHCDEVSFCNGGIPLEMTNLTSLIDLRLEENHLSGSIPSDIGLMNDLKVLLINDNRLTGEIPESISTLTNIELLYIHTNKLSSVIPNDFCELTGPGILIRLEYNNFCPDPITLTYPDCNGKLNVGYQTCSSP